MLRPLRRSLRFVPLTLLSVVVVVALVVGRRTHAPSQRSAPVAAPSSRSTALPLVGPSPPPKASVPSGAARMLHGGPRRTHRVAAHGPREAKVGYRVNVDGPVAAQVTASLDESVLYVATLGGSLTALARSDGAKVFSIALADRATGAPPKSDRVYATPLVHDDGTIYVGTDAKKLVAVSPTGEIKFRLETDDEADTGALATPDGAIVFAAGNKVYSARSRGDVAWRFATRGKVFTAPALGDDGLTIVGSQDHNIYAIGKTGLLVWKVDLGFDVDGAPAIGDDGAIYVGTDGAEVVKLDAAGNIAWRTGVGGFVRGALAVARNGDVLAGTYGPEPRVVRLSPEGRLRGAFPIRGTGAREFGIHGGPLEDEDGVLYFGTQDNAVYAVAPDGSLRWRFETGGDVDAPLTLLSDGSLVVPSEDGTVTLLLP